MLSLDSPVEQLRVTGVEVPREAAAVPNAQRGGTMSSAISRPTMSSAR
jgi:hypothetical protein